MSCAQLAQSLPFARRGISAHRVRQQQLNDGLTYGGGGAFVGSTTTEIPSGWDYSESVIWTIKRHTLSFGFGGRRRIYTQTAGGSLGRINYNGEYSGDNFADSLLGASPGIDITETGPYVQCKLGNAIPPGFPQLRALRAGRLEGQRQADLESRLAL